MFYAIKNIGIASFHFLKGFSIVSWVFFQAAYLHFPSFNSGTLWILSDDVNRRFCRPLHGDIAPKGRFVVFCQFEWQWSLLCWKPHWGPSLHSQHPNTRELSDKFGLGTGGTGGLRLWAHGELITKSLPSNHQPHPGVEAKEWSSMCDDLLLGPTATMSRHYLLVNSLEFVRSTLQSN